MIIFDLDGVICDDTHRLHLLDPRSYPDLVSFCNYHKVDDETVIFDKSCWRYKSTGEPIEHYDEVCDKDTPIQAVVEIIKKLHGYDVYSAWEDVHIWSSRCESVREKTEKWLSSYNITYHKLKMRPVENRQLPCDLKNKWLYEAIKSGSSVDFVFDADHDSIVMWKRHGIFTFDCRQ